jgi:acetyl/propionyl-CoA carboxylase alpha subunit
VEIKVRHLGADHVAEAEIVGDRLWIHFNGRTWDVEADGGQRKKRGKASGATSDQVAAPMPGKITKILVTEDQEIVKGQPVLVMEAMKMEYTLKSDIDGKVFAIHCMVGDQVVLGKVLVKLEAARGRS